MIIALSGRKGAGKNTVADYIREYSCEFSGAWSVIREFSFADLLKKFCIDVLGLDEPQCYGTDAEKNTPTKYKWEDTPKWHTWEGASDPDGCMTGREVMQIFGTESVRAWFGNVWAEATIRRIRKYNPQIAVIVDCRFINEVRLVLEQPNAYVIRLTRSPFSGDEHASETSLDGYDWEKDRCFVLDNANLSIEEQNNSIRPILGQIFSECNL